MRLPDALLDAETAVSGQIRGPSAAQDGPA